MNLLELTRTIVCLLLFVPVAGACAAQQTPDAQAEEQLTSASEQDSAGADADKTPTADEVEVDPDSPPEGFEAMQVFRVVPTGEGAAVLLIDSEGRMAVPIFVGRTIAMTIQLRVERRRYSRPLTHDLLDEIVDQLDGEVLKVHIDDVKSGVFVGTVFLRAKSGEVITFDSRSSDAIAVAVGHGVPIFVHRAVIEKAGVDTEEFDGESVPEDELPEAPDTQPL